MIPDSRISRGPVRSLGLSSPRPFQVQRSLSADSHAPRLRLVCPGPSSTIHLRLVAGTESGHPWIDGTAKYPESLCPMSVLPPWERRSTPLGRELPLLHRSYGLMRPSPSALPSFGRLAFVRGVCAGCHQPLLPMGCSRRYLCESFFGCLTPCPGGPTKCTCLFLPPCHRPSPRYNWVRLPASLPRTRLYAGPYFEAAGIPLCSSLRVCSPPRSFPPLHLLLQGGRGFDIRAERASLPPHAPDLLTARIQAIGGARTCTSLDSQPCRLLQELRRAG